MEMAVVPSRLLAAQRLFVVSRVKGGAMRKLLRVIYITLFALLVCACVSQYKTNVENLIKDKSYIPDDMALVFGKFCIWGKPAVQNLETGQIIWLESHRENNLFGGLVPPGNYIFRFFRTPATWGDGYFHYRSPTPLAFSIEQAGQPYYIGTIARSVVLHYGGFLSKGTDKELDQQYQACITDGLEGGSIIKVAYGFAREKGPVKVHSREGDYIKPKSYYFDSPEDFFVLNTGRVTYQLLQQTYPAIHWPEQFRYALPHISEKEISNWME